MSDSDRERLSKYALRKGDIVFSRVGSVDRRALVGTEEDGWLFSGRCLRVRPEIIKLDPAYLSYFFGLPAFRDFISSIAVGATMPSLNTKILSDVPVIYPPLPEQRSIAHILGTLDDKIEMNQRMNETLEEMARALFKSWFVDFDPVRAKMEGRWRSGKSLPGLPAEHYDLFPDRLVPSELGEIPEGWEVGVLANEIQLLSGGTPKTSIREYWDGDVPWYTARDAPSSKRRVCSRNRAEYHASRRRKQRSQNPPERNNHYHSKGHRRQTCLSRNTNGHEPDLLWDTRCARVPGSLYVLDHQNEGG